MGDEAEYLYERQDFTELTTQKYYRDTRKKIRNGLYQCSKCKKYKDKSEFYKDERVPCGIRSHCKECCKK